MHIFITCHFEISNENIQKQDKSASKMLILNYNEKIRFKVHDHDLQMSNMLLRKILITWRGNNPDLKYWLVISITVCVPSFSAQYSRTESIRYFFLFCLHKKILIDQEDDN